MLSLYLFIGFVCITFFTLWKISLHTSNVNGTIIPPHHANLMRSDQLLEKINQIAKSGRWQSVLAYLRKIDPYVFEELVLTTLERKYGALVLRNQTYSGDGGVDGGFILKGDHYFIQAKRYKGKIKTLDVELFQQTLKKKNIRRGIFVHTGKTPRTAYKHDHTVLILSGERLIRFFTGKEKTFLLL